MSNTYQAFTPCSERSRRGDLSVDISVFFRAAPLCLASFTFHSRFIPGSEAHLWAAEALPVPATLAPSQTYFVLRAA